MRNAQGERVCVDCGRTSSETAFGRECQAPDGLNGRCKECINKQQRKWHDAHQEQARAHNRRSYQAHREQRAASIKRHYQAHPEQYSAAAGKREALKRGAFVETVHAMAVYKRDNWICQLCLQPVDRTRTYPHPLSASLDHLKPLSRGGMEAYYNIWTVHLRCNMRKGNRLLMDLSPVREWLDAVPHPAKEAS